MSTFGTYIPSMVLEKSQHLVVNFYSVNPLKNHTSSKASISTSANDTGITLSFAKLHQTQ